MDSRIRLATSDDARAIRSIYAPFVESTPITFEVDPPTTAEMAERIDSTLDRYPWLVCETADGDVLGYAAASALRSASAYDWTTELSVYVADGARNAGVGTALYTALLETLTVQGFRNAYAVVTLPNPSSVRLHERMDFEPVGTFPDIGYKDGSWRDIQWWYRQVADHGSSPDRPQPLPDVPSSELARALDAGDARLDV